MFPTLKNECSEFLLLSGRLPLQRNLSSIGDGFRKVKVRKKHNVSPELNKSFNDAFSDYKDLFKRCVFAKNHQTDNIIGKEAFYIFPINDFKYIYSPFVTNTTDHYGNIFSNLIECIGNSRSFEVFAEILQHQYTSKNLMDGIRSGNEILLYNIPYYYAIRKSLINDYEDIFYNS